MAKFKLTTAHEFWWPVKVQMPDPERSGRIVTQTFEMKFRAMPLDEVTQRLEEARKNPAMNAALEDAKFLEEVSLDWRQVEGEDGEEVPFSLAALQQAAQFAWFRSAAVDAWRKAIEAEGGRRGN